MVRNWGVAVLNQEFDVNKAIDDFSIFILPIEACIYKFELNGNSIFGNRSIFKLKTNV